MPGGDATGACKTKYTGIMGAARVRRGVGRVDKWQHKTETGLRPRLFYLYHKGTYEGEDGVELGKSCGDEGIGHHVVAL